MKFVCILDQMLNPRDHDGGICMRHNLLIGGKHDSQFPEQQIGSKGLNQWPPRSSDLIKV